MIASTFMFAGSSFLMAMNCDPSGEAYIGSALPEYNSTYKVCAGEGIQEIVNIQKPGFATAPGIYVVVPAGITDCSLGEGNFDVQGGGVVLHIDAFTEEYTDVTINYATGDGFLTVYNKNGGTPEPPAPEVGPQAAPIAPTLPANQVKAVYSATYSADCGFGDWGSGTTYTQDTYGKKYVTTALGYFGLVDFALNCSNMEGLRMAVFADNSFSMRIVPIYGGPEIGVSKSIVGGEWNYIDIALSEFAGVDWSNIYQIKIDNVQEQTFWLNDIYFYTTQAPKEDEDAPENFSAEVTGVSYGSVTIKAYAEDESGEIIYTVKEGGAIIATANGIAGVEKTFDVINLESGKDYSLSVYASDPSGNVTDGISLKVTTLATPDSPEAPSYAEEDVISIFSDSYTAATTFNIGSWGQSTSAELVKLSDGGNAYHLSNANYLGWELNQTLDVTDMTNVRFDVYPLSGTSIEFTPIWGNPGEKLIITNGLVENEWNTVDISLEEFEGIISDNIFQVKWANMPTEMFMTNVLFYNDTPTDGNAPAEEAPAVAKYFNQDWQLRIVGADNIIRNIMGVEVAK